MKRIVLLLIGLLVLLVGVVVYFLLRGDGDQTGQPNPPAVSTSTESTPDTNDLETESETNIGTSVEGREIKAYHYGTGEERVLLVGGIHGGYSWNTALLAYELMEELESDPTVIPENVRVTIIPALNPDGLLLVTGTSSRFTLEDVDEVAVSSIEGRFNANDVDLNRNFECDWAAEGTWQSRTVSGGSRAFSEPESQAFRDFISAYKPSAVVVWYSAAGGVFASSCHNDVLADTRELTKRYAEASGYRAYEQFDFYDITGDMVNWLARERIPAISVLLSNHDEIDWEENWTGIEAVLDYYAEADAE